MRMEESPTRGAGMDVNGGSAKPQSLPQLQVPSTSKPASPSALAQEQVLSRPPLPHLEEILGAVSHSRNRIRHRTKVRPEGSPLRVQRYLRAQVAGSPLVQRSLRRMRRLLGSHSVNPADSRPSSSSGFFGQSGPKTADATSSGFSFKAPEPIQHSTSFTFGQTVPEPARPSSSSGFGFGQSQPQQPAATAPFTFGPSVSGSAFGSAPASPAFGAQPLAPVSSTSTSFAFSGPSSAPPQHLRQTRLGLVQLLDSPRRLPYSRDSVLALGQIHLIHRLGHIAHPRPRLQQQAIAEMPSLQWVRHPHRRHCLAPAQ
ncbi:hypothetical protein B0F90DRAFT_806664 [Multifurca ochricompacta]|uniref:Uncharacterized protein n=1 Tax=Multifurca ochricompacta TaxID=376703 RepID=A0AAD4MAC7_9AGAM|nr:hypothetical protein B0F90DRAFT_806664 [Multifurca ochricompacta]